MPEAFHARFPVSGLQSDPREKQWFFSRGFAARVKDNPGKTTKLVLVVFFSFFAAREREENPWYPGYTVGSTEVEINAALSKVRLEVINFEYVYKSRFLSSSSRMNLHG